MVQDITSPFSITFPKIRAFSTLIGIWGFLVLFNGKAFAQTITVQGQVSINMAGISIPLPMQAVVINLGATTTLTAMTDSTGFYSISVAAPAISPNARILVSTNCPNSGPVSNSQLLNPALTVYNIPLTCGAGGGGTTTMVLVNGALIWGLVPAPAGQLVQFYLSGSLASVASTMTGVNGIISDTLNLNLGTSGSGNLIAVAPCNNGGIARDTAMVSVTSSVALFQLTCSAVPVNNITVQGQVLSNTGQPMVNTLVRILMANTVTLTAYTDSMGFYSATFSAPSVLPGAVITVSVLCGGPTGPGTPATGTATYVQGTSSYTVNLACGATSSRVLTVSGVYLDPSGSGIAGQIVQLYHNQYNTPLRTLTTSAGGFFADTLTTTLTTGFVYAVSSCGPVPVPARDTAFYNGSSSVLNLQLQCSPPAGQHRVSGMITGFTSANPMNFDTLSLVVIRILPSGQGQVGGWATVDTVYLLDSAGSAYFNLMLPTGRYSLLATLLSGNASQYAPTYYGDTTTWTQADSFNLPANATSFLVIDLCANQGGTGGGTIGGGVAGNLPRLSGPLAGIQVQLINANGMNPVAHRSSVRTGTAGSFAFTNIPYGSYILRCEHPGMHSNMVPIMLSVGSPAHNSTVFNAGSNGFTASTSSVRNLDLGVATIYPNPVKSGQELIIHWNVADFGADFASDEPLIVSIRDLQGKASVCQEISPSNMGPMGDQSPRFRAGLSTSGLKAGIYILDLHHFSGLSKVFRLVVEP